MSRMEILANNMPIKCSTVCQADKFTGRMVELWFDCRLLCFFILYRALWPWNGLLYAPGRSWQHILWLKICRIIFNSRNIKNKKLGKTFNIPLKKILILAGKSLCVYIILYFMLFSFSVWNNNLHFQHLGLLSTFPISSFYVLIDDLIYWHFTDTIINRPWKWVIWVVFNVSLQILIACCVVAFFVLTWSGVTLIFVNKQKSLFFSWSWKFIPTLMMLAIISYIVHIKYFIT